MRFPTLKSGRLIMRRISSQDLAALVRNANDRKVSRFMPELPYPFSREDARERVKSAQRRFRAGEAYVFGIVLAEDDELIGLITLFHINMADHNAEVGYWIGRQYWKKGLASEALASVLRFAFSELRLHWVYAVVHGDNSGSIRLLERGGFVREACWREGSRLGGRWRDVYGYGILAREWRTQSRRRAGRPLNRA